MKITHNGAATDDLAARDENLRVGRAVVIHINGHEMTLRTDDDVRLLVACLPWLTPSPPLLLDGGAAPVIDWRNDGARECELGRTPPVG